MTCLYVFYDERCGLCRRARRWASGQPTYLDLVFVPAGSAQARRLAPGLEHTDEPEELVVLSDAGHVYRGETAWIMCLYALQDYREWSLRLASPALRPLARQAVALVSHQRGRLSRWLLLQQSDRALAATFQDVPAEVCRLDRSTASSLQPRAGCPPGAALGPGPPMIAERPPWPTPRPTPFTNRTPHPPTPGSTPPPVHRPRPSG